MFFDRPRLLRQRSVDENRIIVVEQPEQRPDLICFPNAAVAIDVEATMLVQEKKKRDVCLGCRNADVVVKLYVLWKVVHQQRQNVAISKNRESWKLGAPVSEQVGMDLMVSVAPIRKHRVLWRHDASALFCIASLVLMECREWRLKVCDSVVKAEQSASSLPS
jgi:hypothetical protein